MAETPLTPDFETGDMPTREHPPEVLALLWGARETGLLEALLTEAETPAAAADAAGVTERAAEITVEVLTEEGYLTTVDGEHEPTNRALGLLTKTDVRSIGATPRRIDVFGALCALPETMRTGSVPDRTPEWTRNELGAAAALDEATTRALVTAARRPAPDATDVLVLAGASGAVAREFAVRGCDVTVVDGTDAVAATGPMLRGQDVECVTAPITDLPPERFDLAVAVDDTYRLSPDENRHLAVAARDVLSAGGHLALIDRLRGRSPGASRLAVEALATTEGGGAYAAESYRSWLDDAGFVDASVDDGPGTDQQTVVARRPRDS